jgi:hypothetical protein
LAGLGLFDECQRALDAADAVRDLTGDVHNGGWLRFDGTRTAEERGACYVVLRRPDLAESILHDALNKRLSIRRRGAVLTDLAIAGAQRADVHHVVIYGAAALDAERQSRSGVLRRKLHGLQVELPRFIGDPHVRHLQHQITAAVSASNAR